MKQTILGAAFGDGAGTVSVSDLEAFAGGTALAIERV